MSRRKQVRFSLQGAPGRRLVCRARVRRANGVVEPCPTLVRQPGREFCHRHRRWENQPHLLRRGDSTDSGGSGDSGGDDNEGSDGGDDGGDEEKENKAGNNDDDDDGEGPPHKGDGGPGPQPPPTSDPRMVVLLEQLLAKMDTCPPSVAAVVGTPDRHAELKQQLAGARLRVTELEAEVKRAEAKAEEYRRDYVWMKQRLEDYKLDAGEQTSSRTKKQARNEKRLEMLQTQLRDREVELEDVRQQNRKLRSMNMSAEADQWAFMLVNRHYLFPAPSTGGELESGPTIGRVQGGQVRPALLKWFGANLRRWAKDTAEVATRRELLQEARDAGWGPECVRCVRDARSFRRGRVQPNPVVLEVDTSSNLRLLGANSSVTWVPEAELES